MVRVAALVLVFSVVLATVGAVTFEGDSRPRPCPNNPDIKVCTWRVKTTAHIPVISAYTKLDIANGEIADHKTEPSHTPADCGSYIYLDSKDISFRGTWDKTAVECAWVHPLNEPTRLDTEFPLLQLALKGDLPSVTGQLMVTTSAHSDGIFTHEVCCGHNCGKNEL